MRKIIFHHHLFKNAGTSIDAMLVHNFPDNCTFMEFEGNVEARADAVDKWIQTESDAIVFSSHTAAPPSKNIDGIEIFPIIFVRHPIDRIASAYSFERKQAMNTFGSTVARHTTLAGYIDIHLSLGRDSQCQNFLAKKFSSFSHASIGSFEQRALHALETLPFVGLVEEYDLSIERLDKWLKPHFLTFKPIIKRLNVTRNPDVSLEEKLLQIKQDIGDECYMRVVEANRLDIILFKLVKERYSISPHA